MKDILAKRTTGHHAALTDPKDVAPLLRAIDGFEDSYIVKCALQLAPQIFVRPGELRAAEWSDINFEEAEWRYHISKTDTNHIVPLSTQALENLKALPD